MHFSWWHRLAHRFCRPLSRGQRRQQQRFQNMLRLETLEARDVPSAVAHPDYVVKLNSSDKPFQSPGPTGYSPSEISQVYGFNQIAFNGTTGTGAGTTIAIVDAYSDPNIASDLKAFDSQFNLPAANLTVVNQTGGTTLPKGNTGWAGEISLDVEWAHAIAPGANILLVEASSATYANLFTAVRYAAAQKGVVAVSMSWGGSEFSGETAYDSSTFTPPASNPDVVFVNSSGDSGAPPSYPSTSPNVLSVGGTTLNSGLAPSGTYTDETAWVDSGGGISAYEAEPAYQQGITTVTQNTTEPKRMNPDVAYDADPNTGFSVYQTYGNSPSTPWLQYGGTSDAAPQWAALIAIADQGRALDGEAALTSSTLLPMLYNAPSTDFHDITSGTTDGSPHESAGPGYDLTTGLGTPVANLLVSTLVGTPANGVTHFSISAPATATKGNSFTITVTPLNASNEEVTNYSGTIHFTSSDGAASLPANYTFSAGNDGPQTFTVTLNTTGTDSITVTDTSNSSITGTTSVAVSAPYLGVTGPTPTPVVAGTSETFTVTAYNANGTEDTAYDGTATITSSDLKAVLPSGATITNGQGSFTVTFETAGTQSVTATSGSMTGTDSGINVIPGALTQLVFLQQPSNSTVGAVISPAVTVEELDKFGNVLTTDSSSQITVAFGTNAGSATLGGTLTETVSKGVATFSNLTVSAVGTGYTLVASEGTLSSSASTAFNVTTSSGNVIENFQNGLSNYYYVGSSYPFVGTSTVAAHPGTATDGLFDEGDGNWYFRQDSGAVIDPGDTVSVWVNFAGSANGRAYFGFGTNYPSGLDSVVLAPNTDQLIIQNNSGFESFTNLAAATQTYSANTWYLVQVEWGTSGKVVANLYASNGTTLLNSVTAVTGDTTAGTFAFRATGSTKYFSTVTDTRDVNNFAELPTSGSKGHAASKPRSIPAIEALPLLFSGIPVSTGGTGNSSGSSSGLAGQDPYLWFPTTPGVVRTSGGQLWFAISEYMPQSEEGGFVVF